MKKNGIDQDELNEAVLSNGLLREAASIGLDVNILALEGIEEFRNKLPLRKPAVKLVQLRNNICHGNVFDFLEQVDNEDFKIFTPEHLQPITKQISDMCQEWSKEIYRFRNNPK